jgi:hypothetical protein
VRERSALTRFSTSELSRDPFSRDQPQPVSRIGFEDVSGASTLSAQELAEAMEELASSSVEFSPDGA